MADAATRNRRFRPVQRTTQSVSLPQSDAVIVPHPEPAWQMLNDEEKQFIAELDRLRSKLGLPQIIVVENIVDDSRRWAEHLRKRSSLYHGSSQENCAMGHDEGRRTFLQWRASSGHNAFLMKRSNMYCGIGQSGKYWVYRAVPELTLYKKGIDPANRNQQTQQVPQTARKRWFRG